MTDRELLGLAAKACGYEGAEWREFANAAPSMVIPYGFDQGDGVTGYLWNPLTNDGDALRLAVALGININFGNRDEGAVIAFDFTGRFEDCEECGDPMAATRRAIVRAAAEIGRRMES